MDQTSDTQKQIVMLKAGDIAKILQISRSLAYQLIHQGNIPSIRFNHSVRVQSSDLEEFIRKSKADRAGLGNNRRTRAADIRSGPSGQQ